MTETEHDAPTAMVLRSILQRIEGGLEDGRSEIELSDEDSQRLLTAAVRVYCSRLEERATGFAPFLPRTDATAVTATEAVATASAMLQALGVEVFELGLWQMHGKL